MQEEDIEMEGEGEGDDNEMEGDYDDEDEEFFEEDEADAELYDPTLYKFVKRVPQRLPAKKTDIYVSRKTKYQFLYKRAKKLLDEGEKEIVIHGLGAAINRAVSANPGLSKSASTSTVELLDEFQPLNDDLPPRTRIRHNSAIHIRVYKT